MDAYRLYTVVPQLVTFIEQLTNIYVRYNRKRLKGRGAGDADCLTALTTLYDTLLTLCKVRPLSPSHSDASFSQAWCSEAVIGPVDTPDLHLIAFCWPRPSG